MKKVGIIGITAEGASICYRTMVSESSKMLGGFNNVEIALVQPNFNDILVAQKQKDWDRVAEIIITVGKQLEQIDVDRIVIPANSVHFAIEQVREGLHTEVISLLEVVRDICLVRKFNKALVLGVGLTMQDNLYKGILESNGITYRIPSGDHIEMLDSMIYTELVKGVVNERSTEMILNMIKEGKADGCDVAILACTELPMVINDTNSSIPVIDTTKELALTALK